MDELKYTELKSGQLTFLPKEEFPTEIVEEDSFLSLLQFARKGVKQLNKQLKQYFLFLKKDTVLWQLDGYFKEIQTNFEQFIDEYFLLFQTFSLEEIKERYSDVPTDYHNLGKLFLLYLKYFVYKEQTYSFLNDERILKIEQFVLNDTTKYINEESREVLKIIEDRLKIRGIDSYVIYNIEPFFLKMQELLEMNNIVEMQNEITKLQDNELLQQVVFLQGTNEKIQAYRYEIVVDFFLKYLEKGINYSHIEEYSSKFQQFICKVEDFIVGHFSNQVEVDSAREEIYEKVKERVLKRLIFYIQKESVSIHEILKDYDALFSFQKQGKVRFIEAQDSVSSLPKIYCATEVKERLESFLNTVFLWDNELEEKNLPIFLEGNKKEKTVCVEIGLEYLSRFVYSDASFPFSSQVERLEDYIYSIKTNPIENSRLCEAKSELFRRAGRRFVKKEAQKRALHKNG